MQDWLKLTGLVLKAEPIGEYDKRVVLLTLERGKISAFARGARKPNSRLLAPTAPFVFGEFRLYEGRNSYTLAEAAVSNYFEELRTDFESAYYGMYFLEVCDFCTRENNDERQLLGLLYQSLRALTHPSLSHRLVRYIFEIRTVVINGEFPGIPQEEKWQDSTRYAVSFIASSPVEKLYTFTVTPSVLDELGRLAAGYCRQSMGVRFKSLDIIENL